MHSSDPTAMFWYKRSITTVVVITLVFAAITVMTVFAGGEGFTAFHIGALVAAGLITLAGLGGLLIKQASPLRYYSLAVYLLLLLSLGVCVLFTPTSRELPYAALWMLTAVVGGAWGTVGSTAALVCGVGIVAYIFNTPDVRQHDSLLYVIAFLLSAITGFLTFRQQAAPISTNSSAYTELAHELSQVASKSDIVINSIGDGVIAIDGSGVIRLINPAAQRIMGWGAQDSLDLDYRSIFKISDDKDVAFADDAGPIQQVLHGGSDTITRNDIKLQTSSGKRMNISLLVSPAGQQGSGAIIVFRDITSDVSENQQRAEFISTASHEMRTPVAAIEGYLGLALNQNTATIDERAREYINKAHESAEHLGNLFQDLLDVSKAEDGRLKSNPTAIEIISFLRETASILVPKAQTKGLTVTFVPDYQQQENNTVTPLYYVNVDKDHLRETASNLIENAIKYTKEGSVSIDVTGTDEKVIISIKDTGIGIAREDIPHLFQKFYRIDNSDTREIGGTGLGLYLCRRLVESMNGRIWVESEQGKGSMFFVELDRLPNDAPEIAASSQASAVLPVETKV